MELRVLTYNIHKGFTSFNREFVLDELRTAIRGTRTDILFLQEVIGDHVTHRSTVAGWPSQPQFEFLADSVWSHFAYARNAVYPNGHHGNVILSRFPILRWDHENISTNRMEHRGLLHCVINAREGEPPIHLICVHLGLTQRGRDVQVERLSKRIEKVVPKGEPLIVGGDFNDWRGRVSPVLASRHGLVEVHEDVHGRRARTFPIAFPVLSVDRIYVRGFEVAGADVLSAGVFEELSDHAAVVATLRLRGSG